MKRTVMIRRCSLDIQLSPPSSSSESTDLQSQSMSTSSSSNQMTIFHKNIKPAVCLCDPIEIQAIDILLLARWEMEKKLKFSRTDTYVPIQEQHYGNGSYSGLSLKRSLQRFLEKRRDRITKNVTSF